MKRIVLSVLMVATFLYTQAQIVTLYPVIEVLYGSSSIDGEELHGEMTVTNNTGSTLNLRCTATLIQIVPGAKHQYCWGSTCSPWIAIDGNLDDIVVLAPGASTETFYFKYRHYMNAGQSKVCYNWFDVNNPDEVVSQCVNFCVDGDCVVSTNENVASANIGAISPNPVTNTSTVQYDFATVPTNGKVKIHNLVGALMKEISITKASGAIVVEAADFENGIYFISVENEGKVFETKRLVITK